VSNEKYILIVEDDFDISDSIRLILEEEGHQVKIANNGREALNLLSITPVQPFLILLDIMMPLMNGYEFREEQLKDERIASIPTVILSAAGKFENVEKMRVQECLKKPLELEKLLEVVERNKNS
jgi:CheY-like chemotaxis protein